MNQESIMIDTDIISYILKRDKEVIYNFKKYIEIENPDIYLSPFVYYQIKRWLIERQAVNKIYDLKELTQKWIWLEFQKKDWDIAIDIWLYIKKQGFSPKNQDADILIASQAKRISAILITNNTKDFQRMNISCKTWKNK